MTSEEQVKGAAQAAMSDAAKANFRQEFREYLKLDEGTIDKVVDGIIEPFGNQIFEYLKTSYLEYCDKVHRLKFNYSIELQLILNFFNIINSAKLSLLPENLRKGITVDEQGNIVGLRVDINDDK